MEDGGAVGGKVVAGNERGWGWWWGGGGYNGLIQCAPPEWPPNGDWRWPQVNEERSRRGFGRYHV